jgi:hypothetical protein
MSDENKKDEKGIFRELYDTLFGQSWKMWIGSILLAMLSVFLFLIASPWGSSGGIVNWGQNLFSGLGLSLDASAPDGTTWIFEHKYAMLSIAVIIGALASALLGKEFAIRVAPAGELFKGLFGGILMGIGCILAMGCTVGNFFSGLAALSGGAIIFVIGLTFGVFIAVKCCKIFTVGNGKTSKNELRKICNISSGKNKGCFITATSRAYCLYHRYSNRIYI